MSGLRNLLRSPQRLLILGLVILAGFFWIRGNRRHAQLLDAAFRADSLAAVADTTRAVSARAQAALGDSVRAVERRVVQEQQRADALDRAIKAERVARLGATVTVPQRDTSLVAQTSIDSGHAIVSTWQARFPPYTVEARTVIPPPPLKGTLELAIQLDPIHLHLRLYCGAAGPGGIRPARALMAGPAWADISLDTLSQSRDICSPVKRSKPKWPWLVAGLVTGLVVQKVIR